MIKKSQPSISSQKGIATILTVMLVGVVLLVTILGTAYYIKAKQRAEVANHAVTNAQSGAWIGVELLRQYLQSLNSTQVSGLQTGSVSIGLSGITASIDTITAPTNSTDPYQITATIKNISSISQAASSIRVLYNVVPATSTSTSTSTSGGSGSTSIINFYNDLNASGDIKFNPNGNGKAAINVYGNFSADGISLTGVDSVTATGNVTLGSATQINSIYSNGNVTLTGSASSQLISAKGWINIQSAGSQGDLNADNYITITNGSLHNASTLSYINFASGGGTAQALTAGSYVNVSANSVAQILAKGNVNLSTWGNISKVTSEATLTCVSTDWSNYSGLTAASFTSCPTKNATALPVGYVPITATGALITVTAQNKPLVNALSYASQANYIVDVDSNQNIIVTVANVTGIPNGTYYLAKYGSYIGGLCSQIDNNKLCIGTPAGYIYPKSTPSWNTVISYNSGTWTLTDNNNNSQNPTLSLAPGVFLFKGNLNPQTGYYVNTFLSTGNITYGTSITLQAPNYAGASMVCNSSLGFGQPTNLCSSSTSLIPASIGNIALLAGSCTDSTTVSSCQSTYTGGNISLISSATVYGDVVAGNNLNTSGSTKVIGSLLAAGLGTPGVNNFANSTTIDLSTLQDHPIFSTDPGISSSTDSTSTGSSTTTATVKWARYL